MEEPADGHDTMATIKLLDPQLGKESQDSPEKGFVAMAGDDIEVAIQEKREDGRKNWDHPISFILAAVGSAVGLGNVWRFPYLVSKYGGAPFLIPYFLVLFLVGMPILGMELSIGTFFQAGDADAFGSIHPRLRGIGVASVFAGYAITFYYTTIIGYAGIYFVESFNPTDSIPWINNTDHFANISMSTDPDDFTGAFNWKVFVSMLIMWILIFFAIFQGVKSTGWVVKFTVPIPLLILLILIIRAAFLEGAGDGLKNYLFKWDGSALSDADVWADAIGQVFFSLGVCMGVMTTYSSHNNKKTTNVPMSEKAITMSDTGIALMGGFAIYEVLGYMQNRCRAPEILEGIAEVNSTCNYYNLASMSLAFVAYPEAIGTIAAPQLWGILFFGCLILLGIDSAFSLVETMCTLLKDSWIGLRFRPPSWAVALLCCVVGFLAGLLYTFDSGLVMLDIVDRYINTWGMVLIGMLECFAVGWVYKIENQYKKVGKIAVLIYNVGFFIALVLGTILAISLPVTSDDSTEPLMSETSAFGVGLAVFAGIWITSTCIASIKALSYDENLSLCSRLWALAGWYGADELRVMANNTQRKETEGEWKPNTWRSEIEAFWRHDCFAISFGFLIKYFSCCLLFVVSLINIKNDIITRYGGYPSNLLAVGQLIFAFMLCLILFIGIFPRIMYDPKFSGKSTTSKRIEWMLTPLPAKTDEVK